MGFHGYRRDRGIKKKKERKSRIAGEIDERKGGGCPRERGREREREREREKERERKREREREREKWSVTRPFSFSFAIRVCRN